MMKVVINGVELPSNEVSTLWVALNHFMFDMSQDEGGGMGDDAHAKEMARLYKANTRSIMNKMNGA